MVIATVGHVIHSNLLGVRSEPEEKYAPEIVFSVPIKPDYERLLKVFAENSKAYYDFGAMFYLGLRIWLPWLPKKNLWQTSGMYLCTEWVTRYLDGTEDSMITPYKLYLRLVNEETKAETPA